MPRRGGQLRRIVGFVLLGLGVFAVALGLLLRFYAYPQLAKAPLDNESTSVAQGSGITALVVETVDGAPAPEIREGLNLTSTTYVTGDLTRPEVQEDGDVAVYVEAIEIVDDASGTTVSGSLRSLCVDRHTAQAVAPCVGQYIEQEQGNRQEGDRNRVQQPGVSFKFPFGTEQRDYDYYDLSVRKAVTARFDGEETVRGLDLYRFVMTVPPTKVADREVPGSLLGQPDEPSVEAELYYQVKRTVWVDPATGIIIVGEQEGTQELLTDGQSPGDGTTVFEGKLRFNDKTISDNVTRAEDGRSQLNLLTTWPIGMWIGGAVLIAAGVFLLLRNPGGGGHRAVGGTPPRRREPVATG
jgi:hypothetical protein